ncbi:ubiquinone biosynthesis protein UbiH [Alicycliphilus denitrificans]|uniref:Ubiquinone biosynthesis protein UbiH n=1 Tax=Alicycliphilus denitrificans TaxID=179636 RepID=A0A858ZYF7_9BURK|nr:FAD-dependent monooxygenase [Alicycliphilus denitrificans]ADV01365.1 Ubiquinone biosynthesis hydroxylase, UbiH/UbiF/VisC/COQ6 family [Alicycliphilus denitrificans BC]QKD45431.1 ubiquinone biosynthesis protein UbiH [Alicycliphilus denitrificans]GAO24916.1 ubiquinone biosynthesis hydroxylase, ubih/ubif/visc/coq6 family [Alicycliphilus sp. B1]
MAQTFDVCIRGAGVVGRTLALLLARERMRVALVAPPAGTQPAAADVRAYALNAASRALLESVRGWPDAQHATAVLQMQVQADQDGMVRFDAAQQGCDALTWIVDVPALEARLADAVRFQPLVEQVTEPVAAPLTVVCEGRASSTRVEFGVEFDVTPYAQDAIATRLACERPHGQVARQWFAPDGSILAFLPLDGAQGNSVAVVWSVPQEQAAHWLQAGEEDFTQRLREISRDNLGALRQTAPRASWPLQQARARHWCGALPGRGGMSWALAGDAAHNVHPLAGQGLNLGLGDARTLARVLHERAAWRGVGDLRVLRSYERERKAALLPMGMAMDGLQQLFTRREGALAALRNWGMKGFEHSGPLKAWVARRAMGTD